MMSKELKLGLGVGGALLAVLIVYVLVIPASKPEQSVELVKSGDTTSTGTNAGATDNTKNSPPVEIVGAGGTDGGGLAGGATNIKKDPTKTDAENGDQVFGNPGDKPTPHVVNASAGGDVWECLNTGEVTRPKLMATEKTPVNGGPARITPPVAPTPAKATPADPTAMKSPTPDNTARVVTPTTVPSLTSNSGTAGSNGSMAGSSPIVTSGTVTVPGTSTPSGKTTTHVVQAGETLGSIAEAAYGSQALWPHILRANPGVVAEKLRTGTTLVMPDPSDIIPTRAAAPTTGPASVLVSNTRVSADAPIDNKTQYRIASGDSLYRISVKLYGKGDQVEKIYELNKDVIGADPAKLKLGTVLKLPQPPSVATVQ